MLPLDADSCGYIVVEFTNRHKRQCKKMTFVTVRNVHDHITEYISSFVSSKATEFREWKSSLEFFKIFKKLRSNMLQLIQQLSHHHDGYNYTALYLKKKPTNMAITTAPLKGKFPQTTMWIGWVESNFTNPTVKVWADLDNPFKRSDYAKLCMSPSLDGTLPEYVISQEDNSPLTLYIDFHNF